MDQENKEKRKQGYSKRARFKNTTKKCMALFINKQVSDGGGEGSIDILI